MENVVFTGKVGAKEMSFMIGDTIEKLHTAWFTLLETEDGRKVTITDEESPVRLMEAESRYKAVKKGKMFLEKIGQGKME